MTSRSILDPEFRDQPRTMQFVVERLCPFNRNRRVIPALVTFPLVLWVDPQARAGLTCAGHHYDVPEREARSHEDPNHARYGGMRITVCEHMGRLIE